MLGVGDDGIYADAWGRQKFYTDFSLFHALFTFDIPDAQWIEYFNGVEQNKTNATSLNGALSLVSGAGSTFLMGKRHPRYQPARGVLYSSSIFLDSATPSNGTLYAVVRTYRDSTVYEDRRACSLVNLSPDFDPSKGNLYDIQFQWRGVGDFVFYVNLKEACRFSYLGTLPELSSSNPALPVSYEANDSGVLRYGYFNPQAGAFFEWVFDTPQQCSLRSGCVDLSSEGGSLERETFLELIGNEVTTSNAPVLAFRMPETFNGIMNTRDVQLHAVKATVDKKTDMEIYITRDPTALTINVGAWESANGGGVEVYKPVNSADSSLDTSKATLLDVLPALANVNNVSRNPNRDLIEFFFVHGDYLIVKAVGAQTTARAILQFGEEL